MLRRSCAHLRWVFLMMVLQDVISCSYDSQVHRGIHALVWTVCSHWHLFVEWHINWGRAGWIWPSHAHWSITQPIRSQVQGETTVLLGTPWLNATPGNIANKAVGPEPEQWKRRFQLNLEGRNNACLIRFKVFRALWRIGKRSNSGTRVKKIVSSATLASMVLWGCQWILT